MPHQAHHGHMQVYHMNVASIMSKAHSLKQIKKAYPVACEDCSLHCSSGYLACGTRRAPAKKRDVVSRVQLSMCRVLAPSLSQLDTEQLDLSQTCMPNSYLRATRTIGAELWFEHTNECVAF